MYDTLQAKALLHDLAKHHQMVKYCKGFQNYFWELLIKREEGQFFLNQDPAHRKLQVDGRANLGPQLDLPHCGRHNPKPSKSKEIVFMIAWRKKSSLYLNMPRFSTTQLINGNLIGNLL